MTAEREAELREVAGQGAILMHFGIHGVQALRDCFEEIDRLRDKCACLQSARLNERAAIQSAMLRWEDVY